MEKSKNFNAKRLIPQLGEDGRPMEYLIPMEKNSAIYETYEKVSRKKFFENWDRAKWVPFVDDEAGQVFLLERTPLNEVISQESLQAYWRNVAEAARCKACIYRHTRQCPINCDICPHRDSCVSKHRDTGGLRCVKKCEACHLEIVRLVYLDAEVSVAGNDDDGASIVSNLASSDNTEQAYEDIAVLKALYKALANLLDKKQEVIRLRFWEEMTVRDIAKELGVKQSTGISKKLKKICTELASYEELKNFFN